MKYIADDRLGWRAAGLLPPAGERSDVLPMACVDRIAVGLVSCKVRKPLAACSRFWWDCWPSEVIKSPVGGPASGGGCVRAFLGASPPGWEPILPVMPQQRPQPRPWRLFAVRSSRRPQSADCKCTSHVEAISRLGIEPVIRLPRALQSLWRNGLWRRIFAARSANISQQTRGLRSRTAAARLRPRLNPSLEWPL